jgi:hypothetical protein
MAITSWDRQMKFVFLDRESGDLRTIESPNEFAARLWLGGVWMDAGRTPALTPDQVMSGHEKALVDSIAARHAMLGVDLYGGSHNPSMVGMANSHEATMRFEAAKATRTKWAHVVASLNL